MRYRHPGRATRRIRSRRPAAWCTTTANGNQTFDEGDEPLAGIRVSNGHQIVRTNDQGVYELTVDDDNILFVIKPRNWRTPLSEDMLPRFYYIHKPNGSPDLRYGGVEPTGPLPESVDFPLYPQEEPDDFKAILFGDTQPRNQREVDWIAHDVVEELVGTDASFGVTLGDIAFNDLTTMEPLNRTIALLGIPWYNVAGNHDINFDAKPASMRTRPSSGSTAPRTTRSITVRSTSSWSTTSSGSSTAKPARDAIAADLAKSSCSSSGPTSSRSPKTSSSC